MVPLWLLLRLTLRTGELEILPQQPLLLNSEHLTLNLEKFLLAISSMLYQHPAWRALGHTRGRSAEGDAQAFLPRMLSVPLSQSTLLSGLWRALR